MHQQRKNVQKLMRISNIKCIWKSIQHNLLGFGWLKNNKATEKSASCIKLNGNNKSVLGWTVFHISTNQLSTQTASIEFHVKTDKTLSSAFNEFQITWFPIEIMQSLNIVEFNTGQAKKKSPCDLDFGYL